MPIGSGMPHNPPVGSHRPARFPGDGVQGYQFPVGRADVQRPINNNWRPENYVAQVMLPQQLSSVLVHRQNPVIARPEINGRLRYGRSAVGRRPDNEGPQRFAGVFVQSQCDARLGCNVNLVSNHGRRSQNLAWSLKFPDDRPGWRRPVLAGRSRRSQISASGGPVPFRSAGRHAG